MDEARLALLRFALERGESLAALSRMCRRNSAYLQQYVHRGTPRRLDEGDRRLLAMHFGIDEALLGGPDERLPEVVELPYLTVRAAAGAGLAAADERLVRREPFATRLLRDAGVSPGQASLIDAAGDSMVPTIHDGDRLVVDCADTMLVPDAIFVFRRDDALAVKRLARDGGAIGIASDNPAYPPLSVPRVAITVIGRVKLLLRRPV